MSEISPQQLLAQIRMLNNDAQVSIVQPQGAGEASGFGGYLKTAIGRHRDTSQPRPQLTADAKENLLAHGWPGNVRELENLIQRSLILLQGASISASDLVFESCSATSEDDAMSTAALHESLQYRERQIIIDALADNNGNRVAVAETLGISPRTLRYKLARLRKAGVAMPFVSAARSA